MNLTELITKRDELNAQIEALKNQWPQKKDDVFFVDAFNDIILGYWAKNKYSPDTRLFRTEEQAKLYRKINNRVRELTGDWKADWSDEEQQKWYFYYNDRNRQILFSYEYCLQYQGTIHMPEEAGEQLQKEFTKDELKLWICGA